MGFDRGVQKVGGAATFFWLVGISKALVGILGGLVGIIEVQVGKSFFPRSY